MGLLAIGSQMVGFTVVGILLDRYVFGTMPVFTIGLTLLGLHHSEGGSSLYALARGPLPEAFLGPFGIDPAFPLSVWLRDSGGRWHAARPAERRRGGSRDAEPTMRLQLVPPLTRATPWAEVLAGGQTAEVRTRLPLRWGYPS